MHNPDYFKWQEDVEFKISVFVFFMTKLTIITGELIKPGDTKCVLNEGMPTYRRPFEKGRLIIHFSVRSLVYSHFSCQSSSFLLLLPYPFVNVKENVNQILRHQTDFNIKKR